MPNLIPTDLARQHLVTSQSAARYKCMIVQCRTQNHVSTPYAFVPTSFDSAIIMQNISVPSFAYGFQQCVLVAFEATLLANNRGEKSLVNTRLRMYSSLRLAILDCTICFVLTDGLLNLLVDSGSQFWSITTSKQDLHPYEEWSQENCLYQVVEKSRGSALESTMTNKLCKPRYDVKAYHELIRVRWVG